MEGGEPICFHINTLAVFPSPTREKSGHIENARTERAKFWLGQQGQLFSCKRSVKDGSGCGGWRVTLLPGTTFLHVLALISPSVFCINHVCWARFRTSHKEATILCNVQFSALCYSKEPKSVTTFN